MAIIPVRPAGRERQAALISPDTGGPGANAAGGTGRHGAVLTGAGRWWRTPGLTRSRANPPHTARVMCAGPAGRRW